MTTVRLRAVLGSLPLPPGQVVGLIAVLILERRWPARLPAPRAVHRVVGGVIAAVGIALTLAAVRERARRTVGPFELEHPDSLVTTGPYALSRHPMYVGWWLIHLGAGILTGSAWSLISAPAAVLAEHPAVLAEERWLADAFGSQFERYADLVPRYVGAARVRGR